MTDPLSSHILPALAPLGTVVARRMFGGVGLYYNDLFFAIHYKNRLYFKVDDGNRGDYEAAGMRPFKPFEDKPTTMKYYEVPARVQESPKELQAWARKAILAARAAAKPKKHKKK